MDANKILNGVISNEPRNFKALLLRAKCIYYSGNLPSAQKLLSEILRLHPDYAEAISLFRKVKKIERLKEEGNNSFTSGNYQEALEKYTLALSEDNDLDAYNATLYANRAAALKNLGRYQEAIQDLNFSISLDSNYMKAYIRRAQCYCSIEKYDEAINDYEFVLKREPTNEIKVALRETKHLLKLSKRKNYYKILDVPKIATEYEIKKAYRLLALKIHPDKIDGTEEDKKVAEAKFKDIVEAYGILSDPEKKGKYDRGEDVEPDFSNVDLSDLLRGGFGFPGGGGGFPGGGNFSFRFG